MGNRVFHITSNTSEITCSIFPPIKVSNDAVIGLTQFQTYNSIPNIDSRNNSFIYYDESDTRREIIIEDGIYELYDIEHELKSKLGKDSVSIKPNPNTLKCEFFCKYKVDFKADNSVGRLFGMGKIETQANSTTMSSDTISISKVNSISVEVSIVDGSYINGIASNCIYKCFITTPPGFRIIEIPTNVIYLPLNTNEIDRIVVRLVDEQRNLLNFRGEEISLELNLKI